MPGSSEASVRVLYDVSRLVWRSTRGAPTGIDRVIAAYGRWLQAAPGVDTVPVVLAGDHPVTLDRAKFERLIARAPEPQNPDWDRLKAALADPGSAPVRRPSRPKPLMESLHLAWCAVSWMLKRWVTAAPTGDVYLNVAHSGLHSPRVLQNLSRRGVKPVVMIHDLIPITHPEFCTPASRAKHEARVDGVLDHACVVLTNSQTTADSLAAYAAELGKPPPRIHAAPLGVEDVFNAGGWAPAEHPYFVFVGTLEARKNLTFLLMVWRGLAETMGDAAPRLVLAGRRGWENETVIDQLERSPAVRALVHEVADLSDDKLAELMAGARAVLAPSLAEGFDLPVMEALSLGVPAIASDIAAHRELAKGAVLVDPLDGPGWIAAIKAACGVSPARNERPGLAWASHFAAVLPVISSLAAS